MLLIRSVSARCGRWAQILSVQQKQDLEDRPSMERLPVTHPAVLHPSSAQAMTL